MPSALNDTGENSTSNPDTTNLASLLSKSFLESCRVLSKQFSSNSPCPHVFIEQVFDKEFCAQLLEQFPECGIEVKNAFNRNGKRGGKHKVQEIRRLGDAYVRLDDLLRSKYFLQLLSNITGIQNLIYDPNYFGGGTHESLNGERLLPHLDYNYHPETGWYRRLNLLIYLNHGWKNEWVQGNLPIP